MLYKTSPLFAADECTSFATVSALFLEAAFCGMLDSGTCVILTGSLDGYSIINPTLRATPWMARPPSASYTQESENGNDEGSGVWTYVYSLVIVTFARLAFWYHASPGLISKGNKLPSGLPRMLVSPYGTTLSKMAGSETDHRQSHLSPRSQSPLHFHQQVCTHSYSSSFIRLICLRSTFICVTPCQALLVFCDNDVWHEQATFTSIFVTVGNLVMFNGGHCCDTSTLLRFREVLQD